MRFGVKCQRFYGTLESCAALSCHLCFCLIKKDVLRHARLTSLTANAAGSHMSCDLVLPNNSNEICELLYCKFETTRANDENMSFWNKYDLFVKIFVK